MADKEMVTPLHSLLGLDTFCLGFPLRVMTRVLTCLLNLNLFTVELCTLSYFGIMAYLGYCQE